MKYIKEDLEQMIYVDNKSYREIGRIYNVSDTYIKKVCNKLGIKLPRRATFPLGFIPATKRDKKSILCINCGTECDFYSKKFCCKTCEIEYKSKLKYEDFILNNESYCRAEYSPRPIKKYILLEQDNKCLICGHEPIWMDKELVFVLDHIDGDASNNKRENLRLICPNCDSQLDTYKSKNKKSARVKRYKSKKI